MNDILYWTIALVVAVIGAYLCYENFRNFTRSKTAKETFLKNHKPSRMIVLSSARMWLFGILGVLCLVCMVLYMTSTFETTDSLRPALIMIYLGLFLFCAAMAIEAYNLSRLAVCDDGFMAMQDYVKFKQIRSIDTPKGFLKSPGLVLNNGKSMSLPSNDIRCILQLWEDYKQQSKDRKPKKRKNRA